MALTVAGHPRRRHPQGFLFPLTRFAPVYGSPAQLREKTALMLNSGVDLIQVFLSNPLTAGHNITNIGRSILAYA